MQFGKLRRDDNFTSVVALQHGHLFSLDMNRDPGVGSLADLLHTADPVAKANLLIDPMTTSERFNNQSFLAPVDDQEIWAAGVTYQRSKIAREEESTGAAVFYDRVYSADRPELFFKSTPGRIVHPGKPVRVRADSRWSVPEPELALIISPRGKIVGYTIGNDMSARDIEGENPLYLPQAKIYTGSCAVGPLVTPVSMMPPLESVEIALRIQRGRAVAFEGTTTLARMARSTESLVDWLFRENAFPSGAILLTGTGIVPPDDFSLQQGDEVNISITGIGTLRNPVA